MPVIILDSNSLQDWGNVSTSCFGASSPQLLLRFLSVTSQIRDSVGFWRPTKRYKGPSENSSRVIEDRQGQCAPWRLLKRTCFLALSRGAEPLFQFMNENLWQGTEAPCLWDWERYIVKSEHNVIMTSVHTNNYHASCLTQIHYPQPAPSPPAPIEAVMRKPHFTSQCSFPSIPGDEQNGSS